MIRAHLGSTLYRLKLRKKDTKIIFIRISQENYESLGLIKTNIKRAAKKKKKPKQTNKTKTLDNDFLATVEDRKNVFTFLRKQEKHLFVPQNLELLCQDYQPSFKSHCCFVSHSVIKIFG